MANVRAIPGYRELSAAERSYVRRSGCGSNGGIKCLRILHELFALIDQETNILAGIT